MTLLSSVDEYGLAIEPIPAREQTFDVTQEGLRRECWYAFQKPGRYELSVSARDPDSTEESYYEAAGMSSDPYSRAVVAHRFDAGVGGLSPSFDPGGRTDGVDRPGAPRLGLLRAGDNRTRGDGEQYDVEFQLVRFDEDGVFTAIVAGK